MTQIINGKAIAAQIKEELKEEVTALKASGIQVTLAVIQVGQEPASCVYVGNKKKACEYIGIRSLSYELPEETREEEILKLIQELNNRDDVNGILVQLPLPGHIGEDKVLDAISPLKDVDGFHPRNVGALCIGKPGFVSCTPAGIIQLLKRSGIEIAGKECVVIGRSNIVGKPMALLLLKENGTVTVAHSRTRNLKEVAKRADILIVAVGKPKMITAEYVKEGAVVIDVGIHRMEERQSIEERQSMEESRSGEERNSGERTASRKNKLCGDVDYDNVAPICSAITPVPGGVGPMTIAMLMHNCVASISLSK